jgi:hypothetical protein
VSGGGGGGGAEEELDSEPLYSEATGGPVNAAAQ